MGGRSNPPPAGGGKSRGPAGRGLTSFMNISVDFAVRNPPKRHMCYDNDDLSPSMKEGNGRFLIQSSPESIEQVIL